MKKVRLRGFSWKSRFLDKCLPFYLHCGFWWQPNKGWHLLQMDGRSDTDTWFPHNASCFLLHEDCLQSLVLSVMSAKRSQSATSATRCCNFLTVSCTWDVVQAALTSLYRWLIVLTCGVFLCKTTPLVQFTEPAGLLIGLFNSIVPNTLIFFFSWRDSPPVNHGLIIHEVSRSHNDTPQSVGLLWTSDQLVSETST